MAPRTRKRCQKKRQQPPLLPAVVLLNSSSSSSPRLLKPPVTPTLCIPRQKTALVNCTRPKHVKTRLKSNEPVPPGYFGYKITDSELASTCSLALSPALSFPANLEKNSELEKIIELETINDAEKYAQTLFDKANSTTVCGKFILTWLSFQNNMFYHLTISYEYLTELERYLQQYESVIQSTEFFCFSLCRGQKPEERKLDKEEQELYDNLKLKLHMVVRIPEYGIFKKRIWDQLKSRAKHVYKSCTLIEELQDMADTLMYIGQSKCCSENPEDTHFLNNVFITPKDEASISSTITTFKFVILMSYQANAERLLAASNKKSGKTV